MDPLNGIPEISDRLTGSPILISAIVGASAVLFLGTLVSIPRLAAAIPADYFTHERRPRGRFSNAHPALRTVLFLARSAIGCVLLIAGFAMLVLPGQGLLTILAGILVLEFPGKYRLEKRLVSVQWIRRILNRIRERRGMPPLRPPIDADGP